LKAIISFLQIATSVAFVTEVPWPPAFVSFIGAFNLVNIDFIPCESAMSAIAVIGC
jgi:hypothetical protein